MKDNTKNYSENKTVEEGKNTKYSEENFIVLDTMSLRVRETLDAWLKYGTVFLIYRLCSYYFFYYGEPGTQLFEKEDVRLVLFILIGFTIYYMLVKPYIPVNLEHPILRNVANDTLEFGTVLISSHLLETFVTDGRYFNSEWLRSAGLILLAFASYEVLINPFIPFREMSLRVRPIVYDWAKFGTFLVALRIFQGKSLLDQRWILSVLFVLLGFTGYHLVTKQIIKVE